MEEEPMGLCNFGAQFKLCLEQKLSRLSPPQDGAWTHCCVWVLKLPPRRRLTSFPRWQFPAGWLRRTGRPHSKMYWRGVRTTGVSSWSSCCGLGWESDFLFIFQGRVNVTGGYWWVCCLLSGERRGRSCWGFLAGVWFTQCWWWSPSPDTCHFVGRTSQQTLLKESAS